jgi:hypothetical protein
MAKKKKMRKVSLGFVDLGGDTAPDSSKDYSLIKAASQIIGSLPMPETEFKTLRLQLLNLYIEDLPDFTNKNEALLTLRTSTRVREDKANKEDLAFSVEFNVKDGSPAPGFLQRMAFRNVLLCQFFDLGLDLVELDKNLSETYGKVAKVIEDSGLSSIDALNTVPYLKVATKLFDGLVKTFGKNADDVVWSETPALYLEPGPGGAFLRSGIYVLYETKSLHPRKGSRQKGGKTMPIKKLVYRDGEIHHVDDPKFPLSNHLIFSISLKKFE